MAIDKETALKLTGKIAQLALDIARMIALQETERRAREASYQGQEAKLAGGGDDPMADMRRIVRRIEHTVAVFRSDYAYVGQALLLADKALDEAKELLAVLESQATATKEPTGEQGPKEEQTW